MSTACCCATLGERGERRRKDSRREGAGGEEGREGLSPPLSGPRSLGKKQAFTTE
ncbi:hypothetical protein IH824_12910 [candidate division KSB1 bacterium]|nr:hypothetical protein [candidate division KSB1 bacterium]